MEARTSGLLRRERMETTLPQFIDLFCATKQTEGKSPRTIQWYRDFLTRFSRFTGNSRLREVNVDTARAFIAHLQGQEVRYRHHPIHGKSEGPLSPVTVDGYVRALKAFAGWLYEDGFTSQNIFRRLKRLKVPETVIEILTEKEIRKIVDYINPNCFLGSRMYVIVLLLLDTGVRASELCGLTLDNIHLHEGDIKVMGKGSKERLIPICPETGKAIMRYTNTFRPEPAPGVENLILSPSGTPLDKDSLQKAIKNLGRRVGTPRLHPHLFRHTFAVSFLVNGGNLAVLKLLLGHTTLAVTEKYIHLAQSHVQALHHQHSPVERLGITSRKRTRKAI